jgi:hypothetical protein
MIIFFCIFYNFYFFRIFEIFEFFLIGKKYIHVGHNPLPTRWGPIQRTTMGKVRVFRFLDHSNSNYVTRGPR